MKRQVIVKYDGYGYNYDGWFDIKNEKVEYWRIGNCSGVYLTASGNWIYNEWSRYENSNDRYSKCTPAFAAKKLVMAGFELPEVLIPLIADDEV